MPDNHIPFLTNIGFMITYRCTISCAHCVVNAGPHRKDEMALEDAREWIGQVWRYRDGHVTNIAITGGEPFYNMRKLRDISALASQSELAVSVVTNAFWAATVDSAMESLRQLPAVKFLSISTDIHHLEHIPFERVRNAVKAAKELGLACSIAICTASESEERFRRIRDQALEIADEANVRTAITFPVGRARQIRGSLGYAISSEPSPSACSMSGTPVIFPDGNVIGCIGPIMDIRSPHPLFLGNLRKEPLAEILERAESNMILHANRVWGPQIMLDWLREYGLDGDLPEEFIENSICDICHQLFTRPHILEALEDISKNRHLATKVAYGRVYYLQEERMANMLKCLCR